MAAMRILAGTPELPTILLKMQDNLSIWGPLMLLAFLACAVLSCHRVLKSAES